MSKNTTRILILYTELAGYTLASLRALQESGNVSVHLVRWPVNSEAPFEFQFESSFKVYTRSDFTNETLLKLADEIQPHIVLCSGWTDKGYLAVCRKWRRTVPVVLAMDNKWTGTARQRIALMISRFTILKYFSHCWVPGKAQKAYALRLGFPEENVRLGFYTCDVDHFGKIFAQTSREKSLKFPHVFVYAGRYYDFKGVEDLWKAFAKLKKENGADWKLVCLGTGDITPAEHPDISHKGFVQPEQLDEVMAETGVFVLPSRVEPWGVVVQEFAAAGFPLLLSEEVGAAEAFLQEGQNGFRFRPSDVDSLVAALQSITELPDHRLSDMGRKSAAIATGINPQQWAKTLLDLIPHY